MVRPMGRATAMAMAVVSSVPVSKGRIPNCLRANSGVHCLAVRNSTIDTSRKKAIDSESSTQMMPAVINTVMAADNHKKPSIIFSDSLKVLFH